MLACLLSSNEIFNKHIFKKDNGGCGTDDAALCGVNGWCDGCEMGHAALNLQHVVTFSHCEK